MMDYMKDKVIIITGAGSPKGFGKLTAGMAAERGAKVVCADVNEEGLKDVVAEIKAKGGDAIYSVTDVSDRDQMFAMSKLAKDTYGRVDVLVNNAGIMPLAYFADHEKAWKAWDKGIDINIKGTIYGIEAVYDIMMEQKQGHIVNISSVFGNFPVMGSGVYQATKVAIRYITESLRQETRGVIKTTVVRPSGVGATNLQSTVLNPEGSAGIFAQNWGAFNERIGIRMRGEAPPEALDPENIQYWSLDPVSLSKSIIHVIDQPWGVNISDITVRSTGELLVL